VVGLRECATTRQRGGESERESGGGGGRGAVAEQSLIKKL
jgi:hypothetical protein